MDPEMLYTMWLKNKLLSEDEKAYLMSIEGNTELIAELFGSDLSFDEKGLLGQDGVGMSRVNCYQISRAVQAYSNDLIRKANGRVGNGVAIAYDTRKRSEEFSDVVARVLLGNGIGTALFLKATSASQLAFAIRYLGLEGGVLIGAGGASKEYNGLKLFDKNGNPMDDGQMKNITAEFEKIQMASQIHKYVGFLRLNSIHKKIGPANDYKFIADVVKKGVCDDFDEKLGIVFTALHGTGAELIPAILKERGFSKVYSVKEQAKADPEFASVEKPDVTEASSFRAAEALAEEKAADIILAAEPDCQNTGLEIRNPDGSFTSVDAKGQNALINEYLEAYERSGAEKPELNEFDGILRCMLLAELAGVYKKQGLSLSDKFNELKK